MKGCPKHGTKYLVSEDDNIYCNAPIPKDAFGLTKCYYHINQIGRKKIKICTECGSRKAYKFGSLCKICRNKKQREYYKKKNK